MNAGSQALSRQTLELDLEAEASRICARIREALSRDLARRGLVVAVSGGIDSSPARRSPCARWAGAGVRHHAAGARFADDSPERGTRARRASGRPASSCRTSRPTLEAIGCYAQRDEAVRARLPGLRRRLEVQDRDHRRPRRAHTMPSISSCSGPASTADRDAPPRGARVSSDRRRHQLQAAHPQDDRVLPRRSAQLRRDRHAEPARVRPGLLREERRRLGRRRSPSRICTRRRSTPMARHLGLPPAICDAVPTTDTYSLWQGQDEFYFALPHARWTWRSGR